LSNQSAAPSINSLERSSNKSSKKQKVNKILKKKIGEFKYFGGSNVVNKLKIPHSHHTEIDKSSYFVSVLKLFIRICVCIFLESHKGVCGAQFRLNSKGRVI